MLFTLFALLCVGYAHSQTTVDSIPGGFYETDHLFSANCSLMVDFEGAEVKFRIPIHSSLVFKGFWPSSPGQVTMNAWRSETAQSTLQSGYNFKIPTPDETLSVRFALVNGALHPVSYSFEDLRLKSMSAGHTAEKKCIGLKKIR